MMSGPELDEVEASGPIPEPPWPSPEEHARGA